MIKEIALEVAGEREETFFSFISLLFLTLIQRAR